MESPIDIRTLEEAVLMFYRSTSNEQAEAHSWLTAAQCSRQAWSFVWDLMAPNKSSEIQFFGASTLHSKLMKYWHEVPKENHEELKQKLLETIVAFGSGPKIVLNRLCIALSALIVNMIMEWPTAITDVVNTFQNQKLPNVNENTQVWIMMEVLCGVPEEVTAIHTSVQRVALRSTINTYAPFVFQTLEQYITQKCELILDDQLMSTLLRAAKCATIWFKMNGFPLDSCQGIASSLLNLVHNCYWHGIQGDGCMSADENELADACLETLAAMMTQPDSQRYANTALILLNMFLAKLSPITQAEWKENNSNEDIAVNIYTLFISSIECHSRLLLAGLTKENSEHRDLYMRLIQEILNCTNKPGIYPVEESCSAIAMGFWYMLQDEILSKDNNPETQTTCREMLVELYKQLTKILVRKAQQPDESSLNKWSLDDLESFRCYREDISDTLMYCYEVLHSDLLEILSNLLDGSLHNIQQNWTQLESCLFAFYCLAEHVHFTERQHIPHLMAVIRELPYDTLNDKLLGTALETIGRDETSCPSSAQRVCFPGGYCEWFKANPSYLLSATELLVKGLNSSQASVATLGLKDLCRECQLEMQSYAEPLLQACQQTLSSGRLPNPEIVRLMYSVGKILSVLPYDKIVPYLNLIVSPCFEELQQLIQSENLNESAKIRTMFRLNMIATLFQSLNINVEDPKSDAAPTQKLMQPVLFVMKNMMYVFTTIGKLWSKDPFVMDSLCGALKYALNNLLKDFKPMLPDLCGLIISMLHSKFAQPMEIAQKCIILFYKDAECQRFVVQCFIEVISFNIHLFERTPETEYSDIADMMESFCQFNSQLVHKVPSVYVDTNVDCSKLIDYALKAITLPETGPRNYGVSFITHFLTQPHTYNNIYTTVLHKGADIVREVIMCIGVITPRTHVDTFASIFVALNKNFPSEYIVWLQVLQTPQYPTHLISDKEKEFFAKSLIKERVNKRLVQSHIRLFAAQCRGVIEKL
ncbi:Importin-13 [Pseudolycoriella hygida]|uniref:Importin-13 n=1 Tax=Pseudolycoriella hygida TaxID=35572 RepID=A0A9Q0MRV2_9DIPT|nr:Importin-13 [Pseudolycoriella hygida]